MRDDIDEFMEMVGTGHIEQKTQNEIIDFLGYITSHPDTIKVGAHHDASILIELYEDWKWDRERGYRNPHTSVGCNTVSPTSSATNWNWG
jgi:hypothetical protein